MENISVDIECTKIEIKAVHDNGKPIKNCEAYFSIHGSMSFGPWDMGEKGFVTKRLHNTDIPCHVYVLNKNLGFHSHAYLKSFNSDTHVVFTLKRGCMPDE